MPFLFFFCHTRVGEFLITCLYSLIYLLDMSFPISSLMKDFICMFSYELLYHVEQSLTLFISFIQDL